MRTVLITGCTSGFGKLLVKSFLANGDKVIATGRNIKDRSIFAEERKHFGDKLVEFDLDVTDANQRAEVIGQLDQLDILINNAGYGLSGAVEDIDEQQMRTQMEVNFFGTVLLTKECLSLLRKSKGRIFNFSSAFGFVGFPQMSLYCASKFAIEGFSESLSFEVAHFGVQVCIIQPGAYRTNFGHKMLLDSQSLDAENSPYLLQTNNYKKLQQKMTQRPNPQNPQSVADKIVQLSLQKNIPLRVRCGKDAKATYFLKSILPSEAFHKLSKRLYQRILLQE